MNVLIIKTSECRVFAEEIGEGLSKTTERFGRTAEINAAFSACCDCLETGEIVNNITIIYNGNVIEYTINDGIQEFFKTI